MDPMQAILGRRSIRKYEYKGVADEAIKELLHAGMAAPSSNNRKPWAFLVIKNKEQMYRIIEEKKAAAPLAGAALSIGYPAETKVNENRYDESKVRFKAW